MDKLRYVLAAGAAAIAGLLAYGLLSSYRSVAGIGVAVVVFVATIMGSNVLMRPDDRDPTIRPSSVPKKRG